MRAHAGVHLLHALLHFSAALGVISMLGAHLAILRCARLVLPALVARVGKQRGGAHRIDIPLIAIARRYSWSVA